MEKYKTNCNRCEAIDSIEVETDFDIQKNYTINISKCTKCGYQKSNEEFLGEIINDDVNINNCKLVEYLKNGMQTENLICKKCGYEAFGGVKFEFCPVCQASFTEQVEQPKLKPFLFYLLTPFAILIALYRISRRRIYYVVGTGLSEATGNRIWFRVVFHTLGTFIPMQSLETKMKKELNLKNCIITSFTKISKRTSYYVDKDYQLEILSEEKC